MSNQAALPPTLPPRLIGREAAAAYISVSTNTFDLMVKAGRMPRPRILSDKRRAWDVRELDLAVEALPDDGERRLQRYVENADEAASARAEFKERVGWWRMALGRAGELSRWPAMVLIKEMSNG
jgi:hypothetical protein